MCLSADRGDDEIDNEKRCGAEDKTDDSPCDAVFTRFGAAAGKISDDDFIGGEENHDQKYPSGKCEYRLDHMRQKAGKTLSGIDDSGIKVAARNAVHDEGLGGNGLYERVDGECEYVKHYPHMLPENQLLRFLEGFTEKSCYSFVCSGGVASYP